MSTEIFSQVLFNDGEGVDPTDFNDLQNLQRTQMWDRMMGDLVPGTFASIGSFDSSIQGPLVSIGPFPGGNSASSEDIQARAYAYVPNPGGAMAVLNVDGFNNRFRIGAGTAYQYLGTIDGVTPKFLPFRFKGDGSELITIANGDPTNPRVDLVQMALSVVDGTPTSRDFKDAITGAVTTTTPNKRRRIQCVLSVKQGTPAASPQYPDPDPGCCVLYAVYVGANCTFATFPGLDDAAGAVAVLHDQRMPLRTRTIGVHPSQYQYSAGYSTVAGRQFVQKNTAGTENLVIPLWAGTASRLLGAFISAYPATPPFSAKWFSENYADAGPGFLDTSFKLAETNLLFLGGVFSGASVGNLGYTHEPAAGPVIQAAPTTFMKPPIWTNGRRAPHEPGRAGAANNVTGGINRPWGVSFRFISPGNGSQFGPTLFYVAEGL